MSSKHLHHEGLQSWYTSAVYILHLLGLKISSCTNLTLSHLANIVKRKLIKKCISYWNQERDKHMNSGKLDTCFSVKQTFSMEPYLSLTNFHHRRAICKMRISAHNLMIEFGRYKKPKPLPREGRICRNCNLNEVENDIHFLTQCTKYKLERAEFYRTMFLRILNFGLLNDRNKATWLLLLEKEELLSELGGYIKKCLDKRNTNHNKSTKSIK